MPEELQKFLGDDKDENVSVLHLNIRSINKNFENFKMFLSNLNLSFSIISVYIHKNFEFKIRNDLSIASKDIESIGV